MASWAGFKLKLTGNLTFRKKTHFDRKATLISTTIVYHSQFNHHADSGLLSHAYEKTESVG